MSSILHMLNALLKVRSSLVKWKVQKGSTLRHSIKLWVLLLEQTPCLCFSWGLWSHVCPVQGWACQQGGCPGLFCCAIPIRCAFWHFIAQLWSKSHRDFILWTIKGIFTGEVQDLEATASSGCISCHCNDHGNYHCKSWPLCLQPRSRAISETYSSKNDLTKEPRSTTPKIPMKWEMSRTAVALQLHRSYDRDLSNMCHDAYVRIEYRYSLVQCEKKNCLGQGIPDYS